MSNGCLSTLLYSSGQTLPSLWTAAPPEKQEKDRERLTRPGVWEHILNTCEIN